MASSLHLQASKISWPSFVEFWKNRDEETAIQRVDRAFKPLGIQTNINADPHKIRFEHRKAIQSYIRSVELPSLLKKERLDGQAISVFFEEVGEIFNLSFKAALDAMHGETHAALVALTDGLKTKVLNYSRTFSAKVNKAIEEKLQSTASQLFDHLIHPNSQRKEIAQIKREKAAFIEKLRPLEARVSQTALKLFSHLTWEIDRDARLGSKLKEEWKILQETVIVHLDGLDCCLTTLEEVKNLVDATFKAIARTERQTLQRKRAAEKQEAHKETFPSYVDRVVESREFVGDLQQLGFEPPEGKSSLEAWWSFLSKRRELLRHVNDTLNGQDLESLSTYAFNLSECPREKENLKGFTIALDALMLEKAKEAFFCEGEEMTVISGRLENCSPRLVQKLMTKLEGFQKVVQQQIQASQTLEELEKALEFAQAYDNLMGALFGITTQAASFSDVFIESYLETLREWSKEHLPSARFPFRASLFKK